MSSHHFVKEGQEPALLVLTPVDFQIAAPLLEWAPLVMVSGRALAEVLDWGIKIDVVLTPDEKQDHIRQVLLDQAPLRVLSGKQNHMDLALDFLVREHQQAVNILTTDRDEIFEIAAKYMGKLQISLIDGQFRWSGVFSGRFEKWIPISTRLKVRKSGSQEIKSTGLSENSEFFESLENGLVSITSKGPFWVAEALQD